MAISQEANEVELLLKRYRGMDARDISELQGRASDLTDAARTALATVIDERRIDLQGVRDQRVIEEREMAEIARAHVEKLEARDARWLKIAWIIGGPLLVLGLILRPEKTWADLVSTATQVVLLSAVSYLVFRFRRRRRNSKR